MPPEFARFSESWRRLHPEWEYRFHDDDACRDLVRVEFPQWSSIYDGFSRTIQRIDLFRYLVVYRFGGLYVDMDMECLRPVDRLLLGSRCVFSIEAHVTRHYQRALGYAQPYQIANCVFAAAPGHPFLERILARVREMAHLPVEGDHGVEDTTGPRMLTRLYYELSGEERDGLVVLPQINLMAPREYPNIYPVNRRMFARHHCSGTWKTESGSKSLRQRLIERNRLPRFW